MIYSCQASIKRAHTSAHAHTYTHTPHKSVQIKVIHTQISISQAKSLLLFHNTWHKCKNLYKRRLDTNFLSINAVSSRIKLIFFDSHKIELKSSLHVHAVLEISQTKKKNFDTHNPEKKKKNSQTQHGKHKKKP